jgi:hypothetical protein
MAITAIGVSFQGGIEMRVEVIIVNRLFTNEFDLLQK